MPVRILEAGVRENLIFFTSTRSHQKTTGQMTAQ